MLETEFFTQLGLGKPHYKGGLGKDGSGVFQSWVGIEITEEFVKQVDVVAIPAMRAAIDRYLTEDYPETPTPPRGALSNP